MSLNEEETRTSLIEKLGKIIDEKLPADQAKLVKDFLNQYYLGVVLDDLHDKSLLDLYGALMSQWHLLYQRMPGESKIRVYNPQQEQSGWQSPHTVIEIVHDNKPFLLDTIRVALNTLDVNIHLLIHAEGVRFERNSKGYVTEVLPLDYVNGHVAEAPIFIEVDRQSDNKVLTKIKDYLTQVLNDVDSMVRDWQKMLTKLTETREMLLEQESEDLNEVIAYLDWLREDHFTFIGCAEYEINTDSKGRSTLRYVANSGLGVLSGNRIHNQVRDLDEMYSGAKRMILGKQVLLIGKTDTIATVHRPVYTDFVGIKFFDENGHPYRAIRFIGLYTSTGYNEPLEDIPWLRRKVERVFQLSGLAPHSHDGKQLLHIISALPRDEIFNARDKEIYEFAIGILHLQERQKIRLFLRRDIYGKYFSCLVFVPREIFNSDLRAKIQDILLEDLKGSTISFETKFSESILARIHFIVRTETIEKIDYDVQDIEQQLIEAARTWSDDLHDALNDQWGEERANVLFKIYGNSFPASYKEIFYAPVAVFDIEHMERLRTRSAEDLEMSLYRPLEDAPDSFRFKIFRNNKTIPLSDIVPILENFGLRIITERSHEIKLSNNQVMWINDYCMVHPRNNTLTPEDIKEIFQEGFAAIWHGQAENDKFNRLLLCAKLPWRDISILRAFYRYLWQTGLAFSQSYVEDAFYNNCSSAQKLVEYFYAKFDPRIDDKDRKASLSNIKRQIEDSLESVLSLNEDRIIRHYLGTLEATVRTNYFQVDADGAAKTQFSFKLDSSKVPDLPLPKPICEIFVYTPRVEGIHLRGDRVARGGIRWSDRHEDFRTEVLGLMKAQQVKNAVIVPLGAKGGFVVKTGVPKEEVKRCYQTFIRGLLDLTDNYQGQDVLHPANTICFDDYDPYLVVAADKGTATFSDMANAISHEYNFWLDDAFASGGSTGYDHKKMAITARGAWESVKMHFSCLNVDLHTQPITVIGVGDMAGDVFGNGMLQSDNIKLLAAFNHLHIFIDPDPDPATSFAERKRLFELPASNWDDYNAKLISKGGGIFARSAKSITLSEQMKKMLDTDQSSMIPNDLIRAILRAPADLLFNGGIGTFVKASSERNQEVGDRSNDAIRIDANQLRVRVVCEGGNLGFTQLGRIEYAKQGGLINTDAIDNSGGVNCSDNEVNIKILLNAIMSSGDMTEKQRNELLVKMGPQVANLVLANNIKQNEAITLTASQASSNVQMHERLMHDLEKNAGLNPAVEFLPNAEEIQARITAKLGFMRPEIAVLMAYTKIFIKKQIIDSDLIKDRYAENFLITYFPAELRVPAFKSYLQNHRLRDAIIATQISNFVVDEMGINFIQRLEEESGAKIPDIIRAYLVVREVYDVVSFRDEVRNLPATISMDVKLSMLLLLNRLIRRATRWFIRNQADNQDIAKTISSLKALVVELNSGIDATLRGAWQEMVHAERKRLLEAGIPGDLAMRTSRLYAMFASLDIASAAIEFNFTVLDVAKVYFSVGAKLRLGRFGELINKQSVHNNWEALARAAFRDDVDSQQRNITVNILTSHLQVEEWLEQRAKYVQRWERLVTELQAGETEFTMFAIALRELLNLSL